MSLVKQIEERLAAVATDELKRADLIRRAEILDRRFAYIKPKTDVPTPERYFGLPSYSKTKV